MPCCPRARSAAVLSRRLRPPRRPPASDPSDPARSYLCRRPVPPSTAQSTVKMPSHKSLRTKLFLAKKMKQNRPIPQWIRLRTDNRIRYVPHPRQPPSPRSPPPPRATAAAMPKDGAAQPPPYGPGWRHHGGLCTRDRLSCTSRAMQPPAQRRRRLSRRRGGIRAVHTWAAAGCGAAPAAPAAPPPTAASGNAPWQAPRRLSRCNAAAPLLLRRRRRRRRRRIGINLRRARR
jgi:large subunit ribosomal protein L39e